MTTPTDRLAVLRHRLAALLATTPTDPSTLFAGLPAETPDPPTEEEDR
jgi:hypothetical protein